MTNMARQRTLGKELASLQDLALVIDGRDTAERLIRVVGAVVALHDQHAVDTRGRCRHCRPTRRVAWWRRHPCTVHDVFAGYRVGVTTLRGVIR
jgi:hypothetical protein